MLLKRDLLLYLILLKFKCLCVPGNFGTNRTHTIRPTSTPLGNSISVLHGFQWLCDKMRDILTYPSIPTVHRRLEWNWQDRRKLWHTVENTKTTANCIQYIFKSLQHFQRSGSRKFAFLFRGKAVFKQCIAKKHKCFSMKTHKLCNFTGYTYSIKVYLRIDRQCPAQQLTAAHATVT